MLKRGENENTKKGRGIFVFLHKKSKQITFAMLAEEWLEEVKREKKYSTYIKYRTIYQTYIMKPVMNCLATDINDEFICSKIMMHAKKQTGESISNSIEKSIYCVINQVLEHANISYRIDTKHIRKKKSLKPYKAISVFSEKEQNALLSILYNNMDIYKLGIIICLSTGLRLGEICSLKWSDIDINTGVLHVQRTVQRMAVDDEKTLIKTELFETLPKSISSDRYIPLPASLCNIISEYKKEEGYFFKKDKPLEPRTYQKKFKRYLEYAGIEAKNFHTLRHTFATNFIDIGADAKILSELLGHSDVKITLNRYVHPSMNTKRSYINSLFDMNGRVSI